MGQLAKEITQNFKSATPRIVRLDEWDLDVYVSPITIRQVQAINAEEGAEAKSARIITTLSKDEEGKPVFDEDDFLKLCTHGVGKYGPKVVARFAQMIAVEAAAPDVEEMEKNL